MTTKIFTKNSNARVVRYHWVKRVSKENTSLLEWEARNYEKQRKHYGWTTVASIEDVGDEDLKDRSGIKEVLRLVLEGKVDAVYLSPDRFTDYIYEIFMFHKILLENDVELIDCEEGMFFDSEEENCFTLEAKEFLLQYMRKNELKPVG